MKEIGITVKNLSKKLGSNQALNNITTNFNASKLHGVIGPEGAGKTTLLRSLIGLLKPDAGTITFTTEGTKIEFEKVRAQISYMPQTHSLYPDLSVLEHLEFFRGLFCITDEIYENRKRELLTITRLSDFLDRSASKLSGGMYKKLGLMCSLLHSPTVLLLDEPTTGVDPISRREFWDLLYRLRDEGILIIITTAYMDEAERCEEVHLFEEGRIIAEGEPRSLLQKENVSSFDAFYLKKVKELD